MENSVELVRAAQDQRDVIARLMQFYIYDFTELLPSERMPELREEGDFGAAVYLDEYWMDETRAPWIIRVGGKLAGFALLNKHSHLGRPVDFNMGEFFIARPFRRRGAAMSAVHQLLKMHPGTWEIAIGSRNAPAQIFWPRAVAAANVTDLENLEGDGVQWAGPILRFRA